MKTPQVWFIIFMFENKEIKMIRFLVRWMLFALALLFTAWIVPGISFINFHTALLAAFVMGLVNIFIRPVIFIFTLPLNILTLGLFTFVINALMLLLISKIVAGFIITGFLAALLGSIVLSVISLFINRMDINFYNE